MMMKWIKYLLAVVIGAVAGVAATIWLLHVQTEGITAERDITIYSEATAVAEIKTSARFNRDKITQRCSLDFYLDEYHPATHEPAGVASPLIRDTPGATSGVRLQ